MRIFNRYIFLLVLLWNCQEKPDQSQVNSQVHKQAQSQAQSQVQSQVQLEVQLKHKPKTEIKHRQTHFEPQEQQVQQSDQLKGAPISEGNPITTEAIASDDAGKVEDIARISKPEYQTPDIHSHHIWDQVLTKHVSKSGRVDYAGLKQDRSELDRYLKQLMGNPVQDSWSRSQKLAYWINAYNAFTVVLIVDNYPLESIRDLDRPWDKKFIQLGEEMYSLNQIEHDIIRPEFKEPLIHFAVVCAAVSCPILIDKAYLPETLDQQMDARARHFINESGKNVLSPDHVKISQLFNWYGEDFKQQGSMIDFLNKFTDQNISSNAKVEFLEYDWRLND